MANNIWVFCEQRDGELQSVALELLGVARELAEKTGEKVGAILLGHKIKNKAADLIAHGADEVHVVDDEKLGDFYFTEGQQYNHTLKDAEWRKFGADERWGEKEYYCCFKHSFDIPERFKGQNVYYQVMPVPIN